MLSYSTNYLATMPDITVYMNCDTRLAINLGFFNLGDNDEFIFAIKNYSYINSPYVFLFRAKKDDIDENGEVLFKITPEASKHLKPGAFYNFAVLIDAFDIQKETEYRKLTDNGNIIIEYGAQDLTIESDLPDYSKPDYSKPEVLGIRLELLDEISSIKPEVFAGEVLGIRLELIDEISHINPGEIVDFRLELLDEISHIESDKIVDIRLELLDEISHVNPGEIVDFRLELLDAVSQINSEKIVDVRFELIDEISHINPGEIINFRLAPLDILRRVKYD